MAKKKNGKDPEAVETVETTPAVEDQAIEDTAEDEGGVISFDTEDVVTEPQKVVSETDELRDQVTALTIELEDKTNKLTRLMADFENYKKRNNEAVSRAFGDGVSEAVKAILPIVDSFDRAMKTQDETLKTGLIQIKKQLDKALADLGVTVIEAQGAEFDPKFHDAVMSTDDEANRGKVLDVFQNGYLYKGRVLRYAMVRVAK